MNLFKSKKFALIFGNYTIYNESINIFDSNSKFKSCKYHYGLISSCTLGDKSQNMNVIANDALQVLL